MQERRSCKAAAGGQNVPVEGDALLELAFESFPIACCEMIRIERRSGEL